MPKGTLIQSMFADIAQRYDLANRLLSFGLDRGWRTYLASRVQQQNPLHVVDLATGSGDVAFTLARHLSRATSITALDFCDKMLEQARKKKKASAYYNRIHFAKGDCLSVPLPDCSTHAVTIAFGLRNLEDKACGLTEMHRILKPGGWLYILEFSQPDYWIRPFYKLYLRFFLPTLAAWLTGNRNAYQYLGSSIEGFLAPSELKTQILAAGFKSCCIHSLSANIVTLHIAQR